MLDQFTNTIEKSKAIHRFMQVERLSQDQIYELYLECFFAYRDMFMERVKFGTELRRIMTQYKPIEKFRSLKPSELQRVIFTSPIMHKWFVFLFWQAVERQVTTENIDALELQLSLTFINVIPSTQLMEEILNEPKSNGEAGNDCYSQGATRTVATTI